MKFKKTYSLPVIFWGIFLLIIFPITAWGQGYDLASEKTKILTLMNEPQRIARDSSLAITFRDFKQKTLINEEKDFKAQVLSYLIKILPNSQWKKANAFYLFFMGLDYLETNRLHSAFDFLELSIEEFKEIGDQYNYGIVNNKFIPLLTWNMIENDISEDSKIRYLNYISDALKDAEKSNKIEVIANLKITQASYYVFVIRDYKKALEIIKTIYPILPDKKSKNWFDYYYINVLGESLCYLNLGEDRKGENLLSQIIAACDKNADFEQAKYVRGQMAATTGRFYLKKGNYKKAYRYATEAEKGINFLNFPYYENYLNKTLYEVYKNNHQTEKALEYLEKVRQYEETAQTDALNQKFTEWQIIYESEKQKNKIQALENENLLKSSQRDKVLLNSLFFVLAIIAVFILFIVKNRIKLKQKNEQLKLKNDEISKALVKGQNLERKRVASELHDNLNTKIAALKWRLEALDFSQTPSEDQIKSFIDILDDIYLDVRLISHNLIPEYLESEGICTSVQKLIKNLSNHQIQFKFISNQFEKRPPLEIEYQLYNIVLELINNVLKHSKASRCWISLTCDAKNIALSVSDNGEGVNPNYKQDGVGLKNIISRVDHLNGKIDFNKTEKRGFMVNISIPNHAAQKTS